MTYKKALPAVLFMVMLIKIFAGWLYVIVILLLIIGTIFLHWRAHLCRCHHCEGTGKLQGHDAYVNAIFMNHQCYACGGWGFVNPHSEQWYHLWQQANAHKVKLIIQKRAFRKQQLLFRQQFRPYLFHDSTCEQFISFEAMVQKRESEFDQLIHHYYQIECHAHSIMFQKFQEHVAKQWTQSFRNTAHISDEYYVASTMEKDAQFLKKYDDEIEGLESITIELKALAVPEALIVELETSTNRLKQERAIA